MDHVDASQIIGLVAKWPTTYLLPPTSSFASPAVTTEVPKSRRESRDQTCHQLTGTLAVVYE